MKDGQISLAIGTPAYGGHIDREHAGMWFSLGFAMRDTQAVILPTLGPLTPDVQPTCQARNRLLKQAIEARADWLLSIDADVVHDGGGELNGGYDLIQMVLDGQRRGAAIIGAAVPQRSGDPHLMAYKETTASGYDPDTGVHQENRGGAGFRPIDAADVDECGDGANLVIPVARVSGSCWAINVDWVARCMPNPPWFTFAYKDGTLRQLGEDMWFCDRVRERGGAILCDRRFTPRHRRPPGWVEVP